MSIDLERYNTDKFKLHDIQMMQKQYELIQDDIIDFVHKPLTTQLHARMQFDYRHQAAYSPKEGNIIGFFAVRKKQ